MTDKEPKITEVEDSSDSDDEAPELQGTAAEDGSGASGKNRHEKKNRKALLKLGFKLVTGFTRVTVKKSKSILFVINKPEVYKSPVGGQYVCFGEAKVEDMSQNPGAQALAQAAEAMSKGRADIGEKGLAAMDKAAAMQAQLAGDGEGESTSMAPEDAAEPDEKDVELVMAQANCDRDSAVKALKKNNNDVVEAIMHFQAA